MKRDSLNSTHPLEKTISLSEWHISIFFGKSRSKKYLQAIELAKIAPKYLETTVDGHFLHQSIYSENYSEFLSFIELYELVNNWKSCYITINGNLIDRKSIEKIIYCYRDKCRSENPDFCYNRNKLAKILSECHRLKICEHNNPLLSFGILDKNGICILIKQP